MAGVNKYDYRYRSAGTTTWINLGEGGLVRLVSNLSPLSDYEWQARYRCGTDWSLWSQTETFQTSIACVPPTLTQLATTHVFSNRARLNCLNLVGVNRYNWRYKESGTTVWIDVDDSGRIKNINNLTPMTNYVWRSRVRCGSVWSTYSGNVAFTTP